MAFDLLNVFKYIWVQTPTDIPDRKQKVTIQRYDEIQCNLNFHTLLA